MNNDIQQLRQEIGRLKQDNAQTRTLFCRERRRFRVQMGLALFAVVGAILISPANRAAIAQGYGLTLQALDTRLKGVESKTQYMSVANGDMYVRGTNLHVENGIPPTVDANFIPIDTSNGKGNLILGYNLSRTIIDPNFTDVRSGSHYLIVGDYHNYSSFGGIVAGAFNEAGAPYAGVCGGTANTASARFATISGGANNTASEYWASVSGGVRNTADGLFASVSGGQFNQASGEGASVSGGSDNTASSQSSSVSGGSANTASEIAASVSGGGFNQATGSHSSISGGFGNITSEGFSAIGGGAGVTQNALMGWSAGSLGGTTVSGNFRSP